MASEQINWFLDAVDDVLLGDGVPSFEGGQFSNTRANLLQPNQSKLLGNVDLDRLGKLRTRRGTIIIGKDNVTGAQPDPGVTTQIQGLTSYQTKDYNYIVAAHNRKIWKYTGDTTAPHVSGWEQIATGGVSDNDEVLIYREGLIDRPYDNGPPVIPAGYTAGTTELRVDGIVGIVGAGEKLYFKNNLRTAYYEYTIASHAETAGNTTTITLEEPGLVFDVKDNWGFIVPRPALINNPAGYPKLYVGALAIDNYGVTNTIVSGGTVNIGEYFVIKSENVRHRVTAAAGAPTNSITDDGSTGGIAALENDYLSSTATVPVVFAQGQDMLFFCDGVGPIFGWNGKNLMNLSSLNTVDALTGSVLHIASALPPQACKILLWFQNRLIASGISAEPDAIYFSDFFDATSWDRNYQATRIGGGESDPITGLLAWTDLNMLVFKKNSCYLINLDPSQNPDPNDPTLLVASFAVKQLHKLIGCPAPQSAIQVGGGSTTPGSDVLFLDGDKKVHSIRRVMAAETQQEVGQAISLPIQDVLDTLNVQNINLACAMYHNEHYILGFPSMQGVGGGTYNNGVVAYNLLTQSWCGVWSWCPTCFARRTDLGSYSKLIMGDYRVPGGGRVLQWMDDLSLEEETSTTYQELVPNSGEGRPIPTQILTRAFTGGDMYSYKTGVNVEFEFDESVCSEVSVKVYLDKVLARDPVTGSDTIAIPFSTLTAPGIRLPVALPFTLPDSPSFQRLAFDLQRYGTWRELQFLITTTGEKLVLRSIRLTFFMDTMTLQTVPILP